MDMAAESRAENSGVPARPVVGTRLPASEGPRVVGFRLNQETAMGIKRRVRWFTYDLIAANAGSSLPRQLVLWVAAALCVQILVAYRATAAPAPPTLGQIPDQIVF